MNRDEPASTQNHANTSARYVEFIALLLAGFIMHAATLWLVFPGFYDPFWPNHSDFYGSVALANAGNYWDLLTLPRPVGQLISTLLGQAGVRGSIFLFTCLVVINAVGTIMLLRKFVPAMGNTKLTTFLIFGAIPYLFVVFSHPFQYTWAAYDGWATASYTLLLLAALLAINRYSVLLIFLSALAAFLVKETYVLSSLCLAGIWWIGASATDKPRLLRNLIGVFAAVILAYFINVRSESIFISDGGKESPYFINMAPDSVMSEFLRYCTEGVSLAGWLYLFLLVVMVLSNRNKLGGATALVIALPVAGLLALLPNALLPNHHFGGYSWNAAYLLFSPILFVVILLEARWKIGLALALVTFAYAQPIFLGSHYKLNDWSVEQQMLLKRLQTNLSKLLETLPVDGAGTILVTGLNMPFHPFIHGAALRSFHELGNTKFAVVSYVKPFTPVIDVFKTPAKTNPVVFITPEQVQSLKFDKVWTFGGDGRIVKHVEQNFHSILGIDFAHFLLFPDAAEFLGVFSGNWVEPDWYQLLQSGVALIDYNQPELAVLCLTASMAKNSINPYSYYYLGITQDMLGNNTLARDWFTRAVDHDDKLAPNPAFAAGLNRMLRK
jgi:hypothetical protein